MKNALAVLLIIVAVFGSGIAGYALAANRTVGTTEDSTTSTCSGTVLLGCPHFFNQTFLISVNYGGPWGFSYQGYLGDGRSNSVNGTSNPLIVSGNFYGHGSTSESITVSGTDSNGVTACIEAQKLDSSNAVLSVNLQASNANNQTSLPYGSVKLCVTYIIA
jgi:hypothetical protein